jgi:AmiR/NasT family two-component response regulator
MGEGAEHGLCGQAIVARAQRIVCQQAGCTADDALRFMTEVADATDETLYVVAELVVRGEVRFDQ